MFRLLERFRKTPGDIKRINPFDAIYGGVTLGLVNLLGG